MAYYDNFDSDTVGVIAPNFANISPANFAVNTSEPVTSPNSFGEVSGVDGHLAVMTGQAAQVGMCVQFSTVVKFQSAGVLANIAPLLALDSTGMNGYLGNFNFGNNTFGIYKSSAGSFSQTGLTGFTAPMPAYANNTAIWIKEDYDGAGTLKYKSWVYGTPEPASWTGTCTDASPITTAGFLGFRVGMSPGITSSPQLDDLHFGPSGSTFTDAGSPVPAIVPANNAAIHYSAYQWHTSSAGASEMETNDSGAWHEYTVTGTTTIAENYDLSGGVVADIRLVYSINNAPLQTATVAASVQLASGLNASLSYDVRVWVPFLTQTSDRWVSPVSVVRLASISLDTSGSLTAPGAIVASKLLVYHDSRGGEGGVQDATVAWPYMLGQAFNLETGVRAFASMGWSSVNGTAAQTGSIVPFFTPGNDSLSSWNKFDSTHSLLTGGAFTPLPAMIVACFGLNDASAGTSDSTVTAAVTGWLTAVRAAAGAACQIVVVQDYSGSKQAAVSAGFNNYQSGLSSRDANAFLVPVAAIPGLTGNGASALSADGFHGTEQGQEVVLGIVSGSIQKAIAAVTVTLAVNVTRNSSSLPVVSWNADPLATLYLLETSTDNVNFTVYKTVAPGVLSDTYPTVTPAGTTRYFIVSAKH